MDSILVFASQLKGVLFLIFCWLTGFDWLIQIFTDSNIASRGTSVGPYANPILFGAEHTNNICLAGDLNAAD
jgi:hypothetical protein